MVIGLSLRGYVAVSTAAAVALVASAVYSREQFYPTVVYLSTSKGALLTLANFGIMLALLFTFGVKKIFLGELKDTEVEHLNERVWPTVTDTLLMMTIFRDDFGSAFLSLFGLLIFLRIFHWISQDRVNYIEVNPNMTLAQYVKLFVLLCSLLVVDAGMSYFTAMQTIAKGPSMLIMFWFEYTLVGFGLLASIVKYLLNVGEVRAGGWDSKGVWVMYVDFATDCLKLLTYVVFFNVVCYYYGFPLHIIRQTWVTFRSFKRSAMAVYNYRRATANMNERFPDATREDFARFDNSVCMICRDDMNAGKTLPCGHILHTHCLRRWLEQYQVCPTCNASVFREDLPQQPPAAQGQQPGAHPGAPQPPQAGDGQPAPVLHHPPPSPAVIRRAASTQHVPPPLSASNSSANINLDPNSLGTALLQVQALQEQVLLINEQLAALQESLQRLSTTSSATSSSTPAPSSSRSPAPAPASDPASDEREELRRRRLQKYSAGAGNAAN